MDQYYIIVRHFMILLPWDKFCDRNPADGPLQVQKVLKLVPNSPVWYFMILLGFRAGAEQCQAQGHIPSPYESRDTSEFFWWWKDMVILSLRAPNVCIRKGDQFAQVYGKVINKNETSLLWGDRFKRIETLLRFKTLLHFLVKICLRCGWDMVELWMRYCWVKNPNSEKFRNFHNFWSI